MERVLRERELRINAIITNEKKKYNFVFDESANAWITTWGQTAWNL